MSDQTVERFADDSSRYRLDSRIATGGMGEVWRATDTALGREVAVKVLKQEYADDPAFRDRFAVEARHAAALHHPNVAGVFDFGEAHRGGVADGSGVARPFLVMELVEGEPLSTLLREADQAGRSLDRDAVRNLLAQAGDAIGAAHVAGIVHRDVKPANMMVTPAGELKVTDFGIARAADAAGITQTGAVMGTPQYLSPEQARGEMATPRSDVYSLGVVAFECLAGRRPFEADSPIATALAHIREPVPDLPNDVPADLAAVVRRALEKDPADRYADGAEFAAALRDPATEPMRIPPAVPVAAGVPATAATQVLAGAQAGATVAAPPPLPLDEEPSRRRGPWLAVLLVLLAVALVAAAALLLTGGEDPDSPPSDQSSRPTQKQRPSGNDKPSKPVSSEAPEETTEPPEDTDAPPPSEEPEEPDDPTSDAPDPTPPPTTAPPPTSAPPTSAPPPPVTTAPVPPATPPAAANTPPGRSNGTPPGQATPRP